MTAWSDVDDHGEPELRRAWRTVPDDPPLVVATDVDVPEHLVASSRPVPK